MLSKSFRDCPAHGVPERSRWALKNIGDVEVRGHSPNMIWFVVIGSDDITQQKMSRADFLKKAKVLDAVQ